MRKNKISQLNVGLPVSIKKEGTAYIAFTPALDISTYGKTQREAKKSFSELVSIFFEEFIDNPDGLEVVLGSLGWTKRKSNWQPPKVTNFVQDVKVSLPV
ncbi:MAG: hypothetical protein JWL89_275 [Candidatus Saccharibacteria bacterium]|nr:hypothetical protein [Candidatus Saccharibacteria bacterium]